MQPVSSVTTFGDPEAFQNSIRAGQFEVLPTVRGDFRSELVKVDLGSVWMQRADVSLPLIYRGALGPNRVVVVFHSERHLREQRYCGLDVGPDDLVVNGSEAVHFTSAPASTPARPSGWASMSLDPLTFAEAGTAIIGRELFRPSETHLVRPSPEMRIRLAALHDTIADLARSDPALLANPQVVHAFETQLVELMVRSVGEGIPVRLLAGTVRQRALMARFEDFLEVRRGQPVYLIEICKALGVSERTLRAACQEQFGLSPTRYLWLRRMYLARRRLADPHARPTSVTEVAMSNGFWELGRFAVEYRALFGEPPSSTLRRVS